MRFDSSDSGASDHAHSHVRRAVWDRIRAKLHKDKGNTNLVILNGEDLTGYKLKLSIDGDKKTWEAFHGALIGPSDKKASFNYELEVENTRYTTDPIYDDSVTVTIIDPTSGTTVATLTPLANVSGVE